MDRISEADLELPKCQILIIDDNSPFVLPLLRSFAGHSQVQMDVLLIYANKPGHYRHSRYIGRIRQVPAMDDQNIESLLQETARQFGSDLVIPTREWISAMLYRHKNELEKHVLIHPVPDDVTLEITGDKWNLNRWLHKNGFPFAEVSRPGEGWKHGFPVLLKPVKGIGGQGIRVFHHRSQLDHALREEGLEAEGFFLMEYIDGYDIDLSLFAVEGEIMYHTIQKAVIPGGMVYSKAIEFTSDDTLFGQVAGMIRKLDYTGIAHLDFRYDQRKGQYVLVDFNARYWSSMQGSRAMGINFPYLVALWTMEHRRIDAGYRKGRFYFTTAAIKTLCRNLISGKKYPVDLKDTQLRILSRDPLPEFMYVLDRGLKMVGLRPAG